MGFAELSEPARPRPRSIHAVKAAVTGPRAKRVAGASLLMVLWAVLGLHSVAWLAINVSQTTLHGTGLRRRPRGLSWPSNAEPLLPGLVQDLDPGLMSVFGEEEEKGSWATEIPESPASPESGEAMVAAGNLASVAAATNSSQGLLGRGRRGRGRGLRGRGGPSLFMGKPGAGLGFLTRPRLAPPPPAVRSVREAPQAEPQCQNEGPWPCKEKGCPGASISCQDIIAWCESGSFSDVFMTPPAGLKGAPVSAKCPLTCGKCTRLAARSGTVVGLGTDGSPGADGVTPPESRVERALGGGVFEQSVPVGENLQYKPPKSLAGYADFADGTSHAALAAKRKSGCKRIFQTGNRGDMRETVRPMLLQLGDCEVEERDKLAGVDVLWTKPWEKTESFFRPKKLRPGLIVNSVPGLSQQIGQKTSLARLHVRCFERFGFDPLDPSPRDRPWCRFTQRGFAVRRVGETLQTPAKRFRQYNLQLEREQHERHRIWILKPQFGFNQVGIHMYSLGAAAMASDDAMNAWLLKHVPDGTWVLQEYVMNPMTYQGNKFDLRIWAMVTSLDPLRLYLLGTGIPKVAQWKYSKEPERVKEQCIHVLLPGTTECFASRDGARNLIRPYPHYTNDAAWYSAMAPAGRDFWEKRAWPSVEWQLAELLLVAREPILHADHQLKRKGLAYKRVFFLQPDVVIDTAGQATMVEVNTMGYMIGNLHKDFFALHQEQKAILQLMGASGYPRRKRYADKLEKRTEDFCAEHSCTKAAQLEIQEMVHEDMHASMGWYRIFPTGEGSAHTRAFKNKKEPSYAKSLTPLDWLMFKWIEQKWAPKHTHDGNGSVVLV